MQFKECIKKGLLGLSPKRLLQGSTFITFVYIGLAEIILRGNKEIYEGKIIRIVHEKDVKVFYGLN